MSFDIYLTSVPSDDAAPFERALVERAFAAIAEDTATNWWRFRTTEGEEVTATLSIDDGPVVDNFSINRPPSFSGFPEFWDALLSVMAQTYTVLFWPGDGPAPTSCVANPAVVAMLPSDFIEVSGVPAIVTSSQELSAAIAGGP